MQRRLLAALVVAAIYPSIASATPVDVTVEDWRTTDGNFAYSAIHAATGGVMTIDGARFWGSGNIDFQVAPAGLLAGDLTGDVLTASGTLQLDGAGMLDISGGLDFGVASGDLIGTLDYILTTNGGAYVETGSFYFFNNDYTNGSCDANGLCGDTYRLWGNNWDNVAAGLVPPGGNVMITENGVTSVATVHRGIDLGGSVTGVVPEPSAVMLYWAGAITAGMSLRRHRFQR